MADRLTTTERSKNMSAIKSKDTSPEVYFRKKLFSKGLRYRKNTGKVIGHPDIYLAKYNTAIFVNGCFWHRHKDCKYAYTPKSRVDFWKKKFENNIQRDDAVRQELFSQNIKQLVVWECSIKRMIKFSDYENEIIMQVLDFLVSDEMYLEL